MGCPKGGTDPGNLEHLDLWSTVFRGTLHTPSHPLRWLLSKKWKITRVGEAVEILKPLCFAEGNVKWSSHCGKQFGRSSKVKHRIPYDWATPGIYQALRIRLGENRTWEGDSTDIQSCELRWGWGLGMETQKPVHEEKGQSVRVRDERQRCWPKRSPIGGKAEYGEKKRGLACLILKWVLSLDLFFGRHMGFHV